MIYVTYTSVSRCDEVIKRIQREHPKLVMIGGVCEEGSIRFPRKSKEQIEKLVSSQTVRQLKKIVSDELGKSVLQGMISKEELVGMARSILLSPNYRAKSTVRISDGIFGVAIGGQVPVRSVVSRGLKPFYGSSSPGSDVGRWIVDQVELVEEVDKEFPNPYYYPLYRIRSVKKSDDSQAISVIDWVNTSYLTLGRSPQYVGFTSPEADDFILQDIYGIGDSILIPARDVIQDGPITRDALLNSTIDLFELDGSTCVDHLEKTLSKLQSQLVKEKLLGALMFSCSGRGPDSGFIPRMADATRFEKAFPGLPMLGFYAGGEIGPEFGKKGKVALQSFTAVFGVFIAPIRTASKFILDDTPENLAQHINQRFAR